MSPPTIQDHHAQYLALCHALCLDPSDTNTLTILKDQEKVPWQTITHLIETLDAIPGTNPRIPFGTFRGCLSQDWWGSDTELMEHQRSGRLARGLKEHGVQSVVIGDVEEEWYLYSLSQPVRTREEVEVGLRRYFPEGIVRGLMRDWEEKGRFEAVNEKDGEAAMWERVCGEMLSAMQVHLPVRMLARDLCDAEFPVVRYVIEWTPEQCRTGGEILPSFIYTFIRIFYRICDPRDRYATLDIQVTFTATRAGGSGAGVVGEGERGDEGGGKSGDM